MLTNLNTVCNIDTVYSMHHGDGAGLDEVKSGWLGMRLIGLALSAFRPVDACRTKSKIKSTKESNQP